MVMEASGLRTSLLIGLATGVATGLWMWAEFALGLHGSRADIGRYTGFLSIVFPVAGTAGALYRARLRAGRLSLAIGLRHVAALAPSAAAAMALMAGVYIRWLNPAWAVQANLSEPMFVLQAGLSALVGGLVIGVVVLAVLLARERRRPATGRIP